MYDYTRFYINGQWVNPAVEKTLDVINPATEKSIGKISLGSAADVDKAVAAAKAAFASFAQTTREQRITLLESILTQYQNRLEELALAISAEMGAPRSLALKAQAPCGLAHLMTTLEALKQYAFETRRGSSSLRREPVGVCALITPWNWPLNQIACKVAPAIAAGCTMVLKPSEIAPISAGIFAEILHAAGVPAGVFNLVNGDGPGVGTALSGHPDIDMVSFTGSTRAGIAIAKNAADTVKRVAQELGGKSANIILDDADLQAAVAGGVVTCFTNSGQSCNAPTRMFVPASKLAEVEAIATATAQNMQPGDPTLETTAMGPVVSDTQFKKIQALIQKGIDEGAKVLTGGTGKPNGLETGYFVKPTIFSNVRNDMTIAREEIFGPVLAIIPYQSEADAIAMANDTVYGLSGYVSGSVERAKKVALQLRTGTVHLNGAPVDFAVPFGGYKQSGNGREWGEEGITEFTEVKSLLGWNV
jgi:aldehyde dehydrogenase (NAD+)